MGILKLSILLAVCVSSISSFKTNRTSCFHYLSCLESSQTALKQCVGGTAISLSLESKDVNIRDLIKYRALEFVGCQDRLLKEIVDFEALQTLVGEDARECFEKLPESSKHIDEFSDSCDYVEPMRRNQTSKGDSLQCLIEYKQDREYCESLLECCPDHTRCGERMNAVSLSYQNARVKAEQIVYNMISCIVSNDPRFMREGARLQSLRDPYRNAGVPFLRPDAYTEARITRRLALTSTTTLAQRRDRFLKKYSQIRQVVAEKLVNQYTTTTPEPSTTTTTTTDLPEAIVVSSPDSADSEDTEDRVEPIRNLIRTASDKDLTKYVSLISEGKFSKLFQLAAGQKASEVNVDDVIDEKSMVMRRSSKGAEPEPEEEPTVFMIEKNGAEKKGEAHLAHTIIDRTSRKVPEVENPEEAKQRALLVESEIKDLAEESKKSEAAKEEVPEPEIVVDDIPVIGDSSVETTTSEGSETPAAEGSEKPAAEGSDTPAAEGSEVTTPEGTPVVEEGSGIEEASGEVPEASEEPIIPTTSSPIVESVKKIRPRSEKSHCQQYATCWQTLIDYEQQCDRKYSTDVLSHGIDDAEILSILHNSSISHHEIVLKACLRPLDKTVHSSLKQLLVIQRGVRKACLELGRNKIAVTDDEETQCNSEIPSTASIDEFLSSEHVRTQSNHLTCRAKLEPIREACSIVRNCCASVETCDNYIASSPVKKLETEAVRRLVKRQNDCETKMLQTLSYIHEQLSSPSRRRRFYYH